MQTHTMPTNGASQYMTAQELACLLNVNVRWVYRYTANHTLPAIKIAGRNLYDREQISRWMASHYTGPELPAS